MIKADSRADITLTVLYVDITLTLLYVDITMTSIPTLLYADITFTSIPTLLYASLCSMYRSHHWRPPYTRGCIVARIHVHTQPLFLARLTGITPSHLLLTHEGHSMPYHWTNF